MGVLIRVPDSLQTRTTCLLDRSAQGAANWFCLNDAFFSLDPRSNRGHQRGVAEKLKSRACNSLERT